MELERREIENRGRKIEGSWEKERSEVAIDEALKKMSNLKGDSDETVESKCSIYKKEKGKITDRYTNLAWKEINLI